ncbi:MAG: GHKL domain-containing protein [Eubacteriales bacterium]|nr:GHKL domain-containing protein [Eubacteriales bacterium]
MQLCSIWTLFELLVNAIESFLVFCLFRRFFESKTEIVRPIIGAILLFLYISLLNNISMISGTAMTFLSLCGSLFYSILCFHSSTSKKIFTGILPTIVIITSDFLTLAVSLALNLFDPSRAWEPTFERFLMSLIYIVIASALYLMLFKIYDRMNRLSNYPVKMIAYVTVLFCLGIFAINTLISLASAFFDISSAGIHINIYIVFIGLVFLLMFISAIFLVMNWAKLLQQKHSMELQSQYQYMKDEYYENVHQELEKLDFYRHDFLKHTNVLEILLKSGKNTKALEYLGELHSSYQSLNVSNYTNNDILNAIISNKKAIAENNGIAVRITAEKVEEFPCSSQNICSLFDNLFDNAIEANQKVESSRFIDLFLFHAGEDICIIMKNLYDGKPIPHNKTSKSDTQSHGLGLKIVKNIVSQAGGSFEQNNDAEDKIVTITILLPNPKAKKE